MRLSSGKPHVTLKRQRYDQSEKGSCVTLGTICPCLASAFLPLKGRAWGSGSPRVGLRDGKACVYAHLNTL